MLDTLAKIYDDGGPLVGVDYTLFEGDPQFITAVGMRFESLSAVFRAVADDDTLTVSLGPLVPRSDERLLEANNSTPWASCLGLGIGWAWRLTNHEGYDDGVRLELDKPNEASSTIIIELIVVASAIYIFMAVPSGAA
jgi:hypothetical protein